jgi:CheY-like chemotaxis protein
MMTELGRILIADDEETFLRSTADLLRREGYFCDCVANADDGLSRLKEEKYDLLISDIKMPGNPNLEFIHQLRDVAPGLPAILVTGYPSRNSAIQAVQLPVVAYMIKPVDFDELLANVRAGLRKSHLREAVNQSTRRLRYWLQALEDIENGFGDKNLGFSPELLRKVLDLTFDNAAGAIDDVKTLTAQCDSIQLDCPLSSCRRLQTLTGALEEAVAALEKTKNAFKSRELGVLRKKLQEILANLQKD